MSTIWLYRGKKYARLPDEVFKSLNKLNVYSLLLLKMTVVVALYLY